MATRSEPPARLPSPPPATRDRVCGGCGCRHLPLVTTRSYGGGHLHVHQCRHCGRRLVVRERRADA